MSDLVLTLLAAWFGLSLFTTVALSMAIGHGKRQDPYSPAGRPASVGTFPGSRRLLPRAARRGGTS